MTKNNNKIFKNNLVQLFGLAVLTAVGSVFLGYIVQRQPLQGIDDYFYLLIYRLPHTPLINKLTYPFDLWFFSWKELHMPAYFYLWIAAFLLSLLIYKRNQFLWALATLFLGIFLAGWILALDWHFIFREEPFVHLPTDLHPGYKKALMKWPSFPSGHVRDTAMFATIMAYYIPKMRAPLILFCLLVAFLRVYSGAHYPFDSIGGLLIGFPTGLIAIKIIEEVKIIYSNVKNAKKKKSI